MKKLGKTTVGVYACIMLLAFVMLAGCGKKNNTPDITDESVVEEDVQIVEQEAAPTAVVTQAVVEVEEDEKDTETESPVSLYQQFIDELSSGNLADGRYTFIYLNEDDIPELAVSTGVSRIDGVRLYSIIDGKVTALFLEDEGSRVENFGSNGELSYAEGNGNVEFGGYSPGRYDGWTANWDGSSDRLQISSHRFIEYDVEMNPLSYNIADNVVSVNEYYGFAGNALVGNRCNISYYGCAEAQADCSVEIKKAEELRSSCYIDRLKKTAGISSDISDESYIIYDFDNDGIREMFAICDGDMWFVTDSTCEKLVRDDGIDYEYIGTPGRIDGGAYGSFAYAYTDRAVTALISDMWTVENKKAVSGSLTGVGSIGTVNNIYEVGDFSVIIDAYDAMYMEADGFFIGHTWKPYFFNYSSKGIKAYEHFSTDAEEIAEACGFNLCKAIEDDGNTIDAMAMFENGIIVVNYHRAAGSDETDYYYMMWDIYGGMHGEGGYYYADNGNASRWKEYEQSGIYGLD